MTKPIDSDRLLKESNVIAALRGLLESPSMQELGTGTSFLPEVAAAVRNVPEEDVVPKDYHERCMELVTQRNIAQMRKRFEAERQLPKHGRWVEVKTFFNHPYESGIEEKCSECENCMQRYGMQPQSNFCPNCGAKMDGGAEA